jgi:hypothetical protein
MQSTLIRFSSSSVASVAELRRRRLSVVGLTLLVASWPYYVFASSQWAYLIALIGAGIAAAELAAARSRLVLLFVVAVGALLGPEASGALAAGDLPLTGIRILDMTVLSAAAGLAFSHVSSVGLAHCIRRVRAFLRTRPALVAIFIVAWLTILWIANGSPVDSMLRTDLRLAVLGAGMVWLASNCTEGARGWLAPALLALAAVASGKAVAIYLSDVWAIGPYDRLQASAVEIGEATRVILGGGDTLLILAPALCVLSLTPDAPRKVRLLVLLGGAASVLGLALSGTRTGLVTGMALLAFALILRTRPKVRIGAGGRLRVAAVIVGALVAMLSLSGVVGTAGRLTTPDPPAVGLNFRKDELRSFLRLPADKILLGQGLGGRFESKNVRGLPVLSGWSHSFPLWVTLKAGILGLLGSLLLLASGGRRAWSAIGQTDTAGQREMALGAVIVVGVVLMSFTLGRAALPEGVILLVIGASWLWEGGSCEKREARTLGGPDRAQPRGLHNARGEVRGRRASPTG